MPLSLPASPDAPSRRPSGAGSSPGTGPGLAAVVDALAEETGGWVVVEQWDRVVAHAAGRASCPPSLVEPLLRRDTGAVRAAAVGRGRLDGEPVRVAVLSPDVALWVVGGSAASEGLLDLARAAARGLEDPVHDDVVADLLRPGAHSRVVPTVVLSVLRCAPGDVPALARRVGRAQPAARVHAPGALGELPTGTLLLVAGADPARLEALDGCLGVGSAVVPEGSTSWMLCAGLAADAVVVGAALGRQRASFEDPDVRARVLLRRAAATVAELSRLSPGPAEALRAHDERTSSDFLRTVAEWCACGFDVPEAAARLHLHVNTLRYRLRRAAEISGVDLRCPVQRLALQVATYRS